MQLLQLGLLAMAWQVSVQAFAFAPPSPHHQRLHSATAAISIPIQSSSTNLFQASSLDLDIANIEQYNATDDDSLPEYMVMLPRHSHKGVNNILEETEHLIQKMHKYSKKLDAIDIPELMGGKTGGDYDTIFANTYVDLGKVDTVGFDYDYTLVTYTTDLLELIYDMALKRLVNDRQYPLEMLEVGLKFDPYFSIRGTYSFCFVLLGCIPCHMIPRHTITYDNISYHIIPIRGITTTC
jgi:hypothetical protein